MQLWRWIQSERLWRRRRRLFDDFFLDHLPGRSADHGRLSLDSNEGISGRHGAGPALGPGTACDFAPGGIVWQCQGDHAHPFELTEPLKGALERLEAHLAETSAQVLCDGPASVRAGFTYPEVELVVCGNHERWLRRHWLLNGLDSGLVERFQILRLDEDADCRELGPDGEPIGVPIMLPAGTEVEEFDRTYDPMGIWTYRHLRLRSGPWAGRRVIWGVIEGEGRAARV